jgi:hypothetical protein
MDQTHLGYLLSSFNDVRMLGFSTKIPEYVIDPKEFFWILNIVKMKVNLSGTKGSEDERFR